MEQQQIIDNYKAAYEIAIDILSRFGTGKITANEVVSEANSTGFSDLVLCLITNILCFHEDKESANRAIEQIYAVLASNVGNTELSSGTSTVS